MVSALNPSLENKRNTNKKPNGKTFHSDRNTKTDVAIVANCASLIVRQIANKISVTNR